MCLLVIQANGQIELKNPFKKDKLLDLHVTKTGPYFGLQRGKYTVLELGVERQWKHITLLKTETQAARFGFNYNFKYNVLGFDAGYWTKPSRVGLTYGVDLVFRTNFDEGRMGFAPKIGYKFLQFHLETGYTFLTRALDFEETNRFFIGLRYTIINDRDVSLNKDKKKKKTGIFDRKN